MMFPIHDVTAWPSVDDDEQMGTRPKAWLERPGTNELWLFKGVRCVTLQDGSTRCFGENWAEKLATVAAAALGLPAATIELAIRDGQAGVISRFLLVDAEGNRRAEKLDHGNELIQAFDPTYDRDQQREAVGYTLDAVWRALEGIAPPAGSVGLLEAATDVFAGYLLLDALLASTDRHHENWGALVHEGRRSLAPNFDLGTCLGFGETDEKRRAYLGGDGTQTMSTWVARGRSNHFEGRPRLVDLAAEGIRRISQAAAIHWRQQLASFNLDQWRATLDDVPGHLMSQAARTFAFEIVRLNRERLLDACWTR
jgi:hypothetical protein